MFVNVSKFSFISARFVEFSSDPVLSVDAQEYGECTQRAIPGLSFNMKGKSFTEMFVSVFFFFLYKRRVT